MKSITENTELIMGINFGSSETSAALYDLRSHYILDLDILPRQKIVNSAVAILEQKGKEAISIGDDAIQNSSLAKDFQKVFKKHPSEMNKAERERMVAFMKGVYAEILNSYPNFRNREHVIYVAGPSFSFEKENEGYIKMAEDAGLPISGIINKSVAAYFHEMTKPDSKINTQDDGALIVDFGFSTVDFTYFNSKLSKQIEDGFPLDDSEVEKTLLRYAMENPSDIYMPEFAKLYGNDKESNAYNRMLYQFSEAKKQFCRYNLPIFKVLLDYLLPTSSDKTPIYGWGGIIIPKEKINEILRDRYIWQIKEYVKYFKVNKLKENKVTSIFLIGDASIMDFVRQIFMGTFNLDNEHCFLGCNPHVISQGIVRYAYNLHKKDIITSN